MIKSKKNEFFIGGRHSVLEIIKNKDKSIVSLICTKNKFQEVCELVKKENKQINIEIWDVKKINSLFQENFNHQGLACKLDQSFFFNVKKHKTLGSDIVVFEELYDLRNLGSILRTGLAFDIKDFYFNKKNIKSNFEKIYKSSSGYASFVNAYQYTNLSTEMKELKKNGYWCVGLDNSPGSSKIQNFQWPKKTAIIIGNEHFGLKNLTKKNCDFLIKIPINKNVESLNVSHAFAITIALKKNALK